MANTTAYLAFICTIYHTSINKATVLSLSTVDRPCRVAKPPRPVLLCLNIYYTVRVNKHKTSTLAHPINTRVAQHSPSLLLLAIHKYIYIPNTNRTLSSIVVYINHHYNTSTIIWYKTTNNIRVHMHSTVYTSYPYTV